MSTDPNDKAAVEKRLWKELEHTRFGMLGLTGSHQHFQPMTAFAEPENSQIWFFTKDDTDLAKAVSGGSEAMLIVQSKDQDFQACIGGALSTVRDAARIDKYWNPAVAAWFPDGKDDPSLTLLRLDAKDAELWISKGGAIRFAWEVAKANMTDSTPDLGDQVRVKLG